MKKGLVFERGDGTRAHAITAGVGVSLALSVLLACKKTGGDNRGVNPVAASALAEISASSAVAKPPARVPVSVPLSELLSEYKDNEIRADSKYKGQFVVTAGAVRGVSKDLLGSAYVGVGNHKLRGMEAELEMPHVWCFLSDSALAKASTLKTGDLVGVRGKVDGLSGHVMVKECELSTSADTSVGKK